MMKFRNDSGISDENFLDILSVYLKSTFIRWECAMYVQNSGVCIGSKVAPISNIFLAKVDRKIHNGLLGTIVKKVFQFLDDYLVIYDKTECGCSAINILKVFRECGLGLKFTLEVAEHNELQFLDLTNTANTI